MGCINSTKKIADDVFRVRAVRLQPIPVNGVLELNTRELVFVGGPRVPNVVWSLQHLRRYGLNGDVFSFEAGRRCATGPGIYAFRCNQAERLYYQFQRYVNAISIATDEIFNFGDRDREHPSHTFGRLDVNPNANTYLEPTPIITSTLRAAMRESFSNSPLSLELDSPLDSVPSPSFTNELHFQTQPSTPGAYTNAIATSNSNVYMVQPMRTHMEYNNNTAFVNSGGGSAFSTLSRKLIVKRSSLDVPPEECAPMLNSGMSDSTHMYANVEGLGKNCLRELDRDKIVDPAERCYENLSRLDLPLLLQPPPTMKRDALLEQPTPINYIVLDLDQPRSPAQCSPKTCFGSGLSLTGEHIETTDASTEAQSSPAVPITVTAAPTNQEECQSQQQHKSESSLGYSTIDFIKTCALIKSSTHCADFDPDHDQEESRITRHSKCVRKAYSISE